MKWNTKLCEPDWYVCEQRPGPGNKDRTNTEISLASELVYSQPVSHRPPQSIPVAIHFHGRNNVLAGKHNFWEDAATCSKLRKAKVIIFLFCLKNCGPPPSPPRLFFLPGAGFSLVAVARNILKNEMVHLHVCAHVSWDALRLHSAGELNSVAVLVELELSAASHVRAWHTLHKQAWRLWDPFPSSRIHRRFLPVLSGLID